MDSQTVTDSIIFIGANMGAETEHGHVKCMEHSGLVQSVQMCMDAMKAQHDLFIESQKLNFDSQKETQRIFLENTDKIYSKLTDMCVKVENLTVKTGQNAQDINSLGKKSRELAGNKADKDDFLELRKTFYNTIIAGIAVIIIGTISRYIIGLI